MGNVLYEVTYRIDRGTIIPFVMVIGFLCFLVGEIRTIRRKKVIKGHKVNICICSFALLVSLVVCGVVISSQLRDCGWGVPKPAFYPEIRIKTAEKHKILLSLTWHQRVRLTDYTGRQTGRRCYPCPCEWPNYRLRRFYWKYAGCSSIIVGREFAPAAACVPWSLPQPKNSPPDCFFNGLSTPIIHP